MTSDGSSDSAVSAGTANEIGDGPSSVAEYLRKHRDFFVKHADLLTDLVIPHERGTAVSLVEKQISVLREENRQLRERFRELVAIARENEELARRMHRLTLRLVEAQSFSHCAAVIDESMRTDFAADAVVIRLFAQPAADVDSGRAEFVGADSPLTREFSDVLTQRNPYCGRPTQAQRQMLFGSAASADADPHRAESMAVLPLFGKHWHGILVVSSADPQRYHSEIGIDLLAHLGDIVSLVLNPWVNPATAG